MGRVRNGEKRFYKQQYALLAFLMTIVVLVLVPMTAHAATTRTTGMTGVSHAEKWIDAALALAQSGKVSEAKAQYSQFQTNWFKIEDSVKSDSGQAYSKIESQMGKVEYAFATGKQSAIVTALQQMKSVDEEYIQGQYGTGTAFKKEDVSLGDFVAMLQQTKTWVDASNANAALKEMTNVRQAWLSVEGSVVGRSDKAYTVSEQDMAEIVAMLQSNPPDFQGAKEKLSEMTGLLTPLAAKTGYSTWDAAMIPIREGLEALLVVAALLAFVKRDANQTSGRTWIWAGVGTGLLLSIVLAVIVKLVFSSGAFGNNNFLISGWTGVFAAAMLLYMSYWLHSKSNVKEWNQYIRKKSTAAVSTGRMISLGFLAFLAIFREGTETVLFLIGMVNEISLRHLILGLVIGIAVLVVVAYIMIGIGIRLPIRPFFLISSLIVFYLCLKFAGMGIHSLQLAGTVPITMAHGVPTLSWLAVYPTWQSALVQSAIVLVALVVLLVRALRQRRQSEQTA